ncbi:hypothetical protein Gotur_025887, partial [Gossypium turneri]
MSRFEKIVKKAGPTKGMSHETRNTFLVVTVLIIRSTYEACLNPPKMPDDSPCPSLKYQISLNQDQPLNSHTFLHKTDMNTAPMPSPSAMDVSEKVDLLYEISYETALGDYRLADSVNNFFAFVINLIVPCQPNRLLKVVMRVEEGLFCDICCNDKRSVNLFV